MSYAIERIWIDNSLRNYQYLVACKRTSQAVIVDPINARLCVEALEQHGWQAVGVLITHGHGDHVAGNVDLAAQLGLPIHAPRASMPAVTNVVVDGDHVSCGDLDFTVISAPGHCVDHVVYYSEVGEPLLVAGDVLFNAGVGRAAGSDIDILFDSVERLMQTLPAATAFLPGHDYFEANLRFAAHLLPDDLPVVEMLELLKGQSPDDRPILRLSDEQRYNPFLRIHDEAWRARLAAAGHVDSNITPRALFRWLREQRNEW